MANSIITIISAMLNAMEWDFLFILSIYSHNTKTIAFSSPLSFLLFQVYANSEFSVRFGQHENLVSGDRPLLPQPLDRGLHQRGLRGLKSLE